jgi:hypothetical protein
MLTSRFGSDEALLQADIRNIPISDATDTNRTYRKD